MKPSFSRSAKSSAPVKSASANLPGLAHPIDLADGRRVRSTTVFCLRRGDSVVVAADGQVSVGATVMKGSAKKIRRLYQGKVSPVFAGCLGILVSFFVLRPENVRTHSPL